MLRARPQHAAAVAADAAFVPLVGRAHGHDLGEVHALEAGERPRRAQRDFGIGPVRRRDAAALCAALAQDAGELARVDARDRDGLALDEEL
jgi:hypothetical protein